MISTSWLNLALEYGRSIIVFPATVHKPNPALRSSLSCSLLNQCAQVSVSFYTHLAFPATFIHALTLRRGEARFPVLTFQSHFSVKDPIERFRQRKDPSIWYDPIADDFRLWGAPRLRFGQFLSTVHRLVLWAGVSAMNNEQEVQIQTCGPGRGNPTLERQVHCCGLPQLNQRDAKRWEAARGCAVEAIGARTCRTKVKRRKACAADEPACSGEIQYLLVVACELATAGVRSLFILTQRDLLGWRRLSLGFHRRKMRRRPVRWNSAHTESRRAQQRPLRASLIRPLHPSLCLTNKCDAIVALWDDGRPAPPGLPGDAHGCCTRVACPYVLVCLLPYSGSGVQPL